MPLARALVAGGLTVLEVTLRTKCALASIKRIVAEVPDAVVGAGTILTQRTWRRPSRPAVPGQSQCHTGVLDAMLDSGPPLTGGGPRRVLEAASVD